LRGPVKKEKLEAIKKKREDFEQKNYEVKMAMLRAEKKKEAGGIRIAPKEFTNFTDKQLERLIRHQLRKNPHLLKHRKYIETKASYKLIEKKVTGPRIINKKTTGKTTIEKEVIA